MVLVTKTLTGVTSQAAEWPRAGAGQALGSLGFAEGRCSPVVGAEVAPQEKVA